MNEKQCVRCGRAGHDSAECKWPVLPAATNVDAVAEPHPYAGKRKGHPDGDFSYRCGSDYCRCAQ